MPKKGATSVYHGVSYENASTGMICAIRWKAARPWAGYARINGHRVKKHFATEREAAIYTDKLTIKYKLNRPLNILKPKQ